MRLYWDPSIFQKTRKYVYKETLSRSPLLPHPRAWAPFLPPLSDAKREVL